MEHDIHAHFEHPDHCPYCTGGEIEGGSVEIDTGTARQRVGCLQCNRHWIDIYHLAAVIDDGGHRHERSVRSHAPAPASIDPRQRHLRQAQIVPHETLSRCHVSVIGVGAIGRQVALQLAAMGVMRLELIDPQIVEPVNLGAQAYLEADLGLPKAEATARLCARINSAIEIDPLIERFRRSREVGNIVFCCVDSIETRSLIWESVRERAELFIDGRMSAEVVRILSVTDAAGREHYPSTLFASAQAYSEPCTARSTIFTANIAAGLMLEQFSRHLRRLPVDPDLTLNLLTSELTLAPTPQ